MTDDQCGSGCFGCGYKGPEGSAQFSPQMDWISISLSSLLSNR